MSAPKLLPALLGGLFIGVLSSLPIVSTANFCCCLWVVCGGALAAWLMQQNTPRRVTYGEGALVGLLAGIVGTIVWGVLMTGLAVIAGTGVGVDEFRRAIEEADLPPETREAFQQVGPVFLLGALFVGWGVMNMAFAVLGGLAGVAIFGKKAPPAGPGAPPTFTPPSFTPPTPSSTPPSPFGGAPPAPPSGFPPPPPPSSTPSGFAPLESSAPAGAFPFPPAPAPFPPAPAPAPPAPPPPAPAPAPVPSPAEDPYAGDAPTIMIPRGGNVPGFPAAPKPPSPAPPAPLPGGITTPDREPDSR